MAPVHLRGFNVADVQKKEYVCPGEPALPALPSWAKIHMPVRPLILIIPIPGIWYGRNPIVS